MEEAIMLDPYYIVRQIPLLIIVVFGIIRFLEFCRDYFVKAIGFVGKMRIIMLGGSFSLTFTPAIIQTFFEIFNVFSGYESIMYSLSITTLVIAIFLSPFVRSNNDSSKNEIQDEHEED